MHLDMNNLSLPACAEASVGRRAPIYRDAAISIPRVIINAVLFFGTIAVFVQCNNVFSQDINDTSKIIIKRIAKSNPLMYNISEIHMKKDNPNLYVVRVDVEVPLSTKLRLSVKDTSNDILMYLINDEVVPKGTYRVRWEMPYCKADLNCN